MLILTRRPGETLIIETSTGEQIEVTVLEIKGKQGQDRHSGAGRYSDCAGRFAGH